MRFGLVVGIIWAGMIVANAAAAERYAQAAAAYDGKQYAEAKALYEHLLHEGLRAPELYFNLANTYYRIGDFGQAILHYMNAFYFAPRDPDIRHNLKYVLHEADAVAPAIAWTAHIFRLANRSEWTALATLFWWLTAMHTLFVCRPNQRRLCKLSMIIAAALLVFCLAGIQHWRQWRSQPMIVVTSAGQEALFAPLADATAHFAMPQGSIARVDASLDGWYRIRVNKKDGWIRQSDVTRVAPWTP